MPAPDDTTHQVEASIEREYNRRVSAWTGNNVSSDIDDPASTVHGDSIIVAQLSSSEEGIRDGINPKGIRPHIDGKAGEEGV